MAEKPPEEEVFCGTPASRGIAFGPVHVAARGFSAPNVYEIPEDGLKLEKGRLTAAFDITRQQLASLKTKIDEVAGGDEGLVFEAHGMVLDDPSLQTKVELAIENRKQNAEYCFYAVMQTVLEAMRRISDPYLRERTIDIEDVSQRVLRNFEASTNIIGLDHQHLFVAHDLTPSDTASMDRSKLLGFVTEEGSVNSHTAILARALGIPAIVGLGKVVVEITALAPAIVDGYSGKFIVHPSEETTKYYRSLANRKREQRKALEELRDQESTTKDGRHITLSANIEFTHELDLVQDNRAEGVGLFRTEFFLLETGYPPTEKNQTETYTELAKRTGSHPAIIRTLDSGGDKLSVEPLTEPEPNPFLGWRGIRVSLDRPDFFKEQLRAILRASAHGKLGMMFPFISGVSEIQRCQALVKECMAELEAEGCKFDADLEIGAMIEIPSAVLVADEIAQEVDFFSIGTNDLIQYTVAVDRINNRVAKLYRSTHPAVIRMIKMTTDAASRAGIWTGICGEMAADLSLTPLLVGLGVDELSVGPHEVAPVRKALLSVDFGECKALAQKALAMPTSAEIYHLSHEAAKAAYPDLIDEDE
ncbi:MAG: phosphoenolpyruvate--protein phosphotransferase [Akkermansiaceae bacterium]|nr:phosphoenolpyruvate--protein phosphotransferase [Akkermansiaceae bacterium]